LKLKTYLLACSAALSVISAGELDAAPNEIVKVQTLTFDSLITRRAKWKFPDNADKYRKILLYYTLKCDPRTTQDGWNCGEWDYLTYALLHKPLNRDTCYDRTYPKYKVGNKTIQSIKYVANAKDKAPYTSKMERKITTAITKAEGLKNIDFGAQAKDIIIGSEPARFQILLSKSDLKSSGINNPTTIGKIRLFAANSGAALKNLKIKYQKVGVNELNGFEKDLITIYSGDYTFAKDGWNEVELNQIITLSQSQNVLLEISCDGASGSSLTLKGFEATKSINASYVNNYLQFSGDGQYAYTDNINLLSKASKFTMETWFKVDQWKNWTKIMGVGGNTIVELGDTLGDIYCWTRNPANSNVKIKEAVKIGEWNHIAMVFDGSNSKNRDSVVRVYLNGEWASTYRSGSFPINASDEKASFSATDIYSDNATIKGGMYDIRLWNTCLTQDQIREWMNKNIDESHPSYSNLQVNYLLNDNSSSALIDRSSKKNNGVLYGLPEKTQLPGDQLFVINNKYAAAPCFSFVAGQYELDNDTSVVENKIYESVKTIAEYAIKDSLPVVASQKYGWLEGYYYKYDINGKKIDSTLYKGDLIITNEDLKYKSKAEALYDNIELARYITPYGIGLDLGPEGFTWVYDVTDYAPLLKGELEMSFGNQQELVDARFDFIKGTPPRDVLAMKEIWGNYASYLYKDLDDDNALSEVSVPLAQGIKQAKIKTRLTGHGHANNQRDDEEKVAPHCCEWKDNTHTLYVDGSDMKWHIWQTNDCAMNPVYPQGGTWPGSREGWCPGDIVKENEFELTKYVKKNDKTMSFDYEITPVPSDIKGMGKGNYIISMQLFEYGDANNAIDAEVYDVFAPNTNKYYSRFNPSCYGPKVVIRNNGASNLTSLKFQYGVSGGLTETYSWSGALEPNQKDTIDLPISSTAFWMGDEQKKFTVKISEPNGAQDQYADNDEMTTPYERPDIYASKKALLRIATNNYGQYYHLVVKDYSGKVVINRNSMSSKMTYKDTLNMPDGCYTLELLDDNNFGLSYWPVGGLGSGYIQIVGLDNKVIKEFKANFGHKLIYSFRIGEVNYVEDANHNDMLNIYPNPAENYLNFYVAANMENADITIFDAAGNIIIEKTTNISDGENFNFDVSNLAAGAYYIRIRNGVYDIQKNFIKK
jgi:hypothetical protein